jgi:hypothetical protein
MNKLHKLKLIIEAINEHNITAYEIGKNTNISTFAIQKIIKGETKNPNERTLDIILEFLEKAIVGTDIKENRVEEPKEVYTTHSDLQVQMMVLQREHIALMKEKDRLTKLLEKHNIKH